MCVYIFSQYFIFIWRVRIPQVFLTFSLRNDLLILWTFKLTTSLVKWMWSLLIFITILKSKNTVYLFFLSFLRPTQKKTKSWENHYQMIIMIDWNGFDGKTCNCNHDLSWVLLWRKVYHSYMCIFWLIRLF